MVKVDTSKYLLGSIGIYTLAKAHPDPRYLISSSSLDHHYQYCNSSLYVSLPQYVHPASNWLHNG